MSWNQLKISSYPAMSNRSRRTDSEHPISSHSQTIPEYPVSVLSCCSCRSGMHVRPGLPAIVGPLQGHGGGAGEPDQHVELEAGIEGVQFFVRQMRRRALADNGSSRIIE